MANGKRKQSEIAFPWATSGNGSQALAAIPSEIPTELVACRAYELWQQRGCPLWDGERDWFAARAELERERAAPLAARGVLRVAVAAR